MIDRINFPKTRLFHVVRYQAYFKKEITAHQEAIKKTLINPYSTDETAFKILNQQALSNPLPNHEIANAWKVAEPFVHLSTSQMIELIYNHLWPLEKLLTRLSYELEQELSHSTPWFYRNSQNKAELNTETSHCLQQLNNIHHHLQQALWQRTQVHHLCDQDRHFDDVKSYFWLTKNNQERKRFGLSDDLRIKIYDYLKHSSFPIDEIIEPIRQAPYQSIQPSKNSRRYQKTFNSLVSPLEQHLAPDSGNLPKNNVNEESFFAQINDQAKNLFSKLPFLPLLSPLYRWRYLAYFVLTSLIASALLNPIAPLLTFFLGQTMGTILYSALFSMVTLSPAIALIVQKKNTVKRWWKDLFESHKTASLLKALDVLKLNDSYLNQEFTRGILDTAFYDVHHLERLFEQSIQRITDAYPNAERFSFFVSHETQEKLKDVKRLLTLQVKMLKARRVEYCDHLIERFKQDMGKMVQGVNEGLKPMINHHQVEHIGAFIHHHGTNEQQLSWSESLKFEQQWAKQLQSQGFCFAAHSSNPTDISWGGFTPNRASLMGWKLLLGHINQPVYQDLIEGLLGQWPPHHRFSDLELPDKIVKAAQDHIFACLPHLPRHYVHLLRDEQKEQLNNWHLTHIIELNTAQNFLEKFIGTQFNLSMLSTLSKKQAANMVQLLDNALLVHELNGIKDTSHKIRELIERNTGEMSNAFYLLRFFTPEERPTIAHQLATQRLTWMLHNPKDAVIHRHDLELFHNSELVQYQGEFDFKKIVFKHLLNDPSLNPDLQTLLLQFEVNGLDDGSLANIYLKTCKLEALSNSNDQNTFRNSVCLK